MAAMSRLRFDISGGMESQVKMQSFALTVDPFEMKIDDCILSIRQCVDRGKVNDVIVDCQPCPPSN